MDAADKNNCFEAFARAAMYWAMAYQSLGYRALGAFMELGKYPKPQKNAESPKT